jgi:hypothetical protein
LVPVTSSPVVESAGPVDPSPASSTKTPSDASLPHPANAPTAPAADSERRIHKRLFMPVLLVQMRSVVAMSALSKPERGGASPDAGPG